MLSRPILEGFLPLASHLEGEGDAGRLRLLYIVGSRLILALCLPLLCVVTTLAGPLLTLWVGAKYADNAPIVVILALAGLLEVSCWPGRSILQGIAHHRGIAAASVCAAVANLGLSLLLIRYYGIVGVALGTLIPTIIVYLGFIWPHTLRVIGVSVPELSRQVLLPALLPTLPTIAVLYGILSMAGPESVVAVAATAAAGVTTYVAVYLTFCAGDQEWQLLVNIIRRLSAALSSHPEHL
jgi:O-antigen/teichoic acid export membrane protein